MLCRIDIFSELIAELLERGESVTFAVNGTSMYPTIKDGDVIRVSRAAPSELAAGDVIAFRRGLNLVVHRAARLLRDDGGRVSRVLTTGDGLQVPDGSCAIGDVLGVVTEVRTRQGVWHPNTRIRRIHGRWRAFLTLHPRARTPLRIAKQGLRSISPGKRTRCAPHGGGTRT